MNPGDDKYPVGFGRPVVILSGGKGIGGSLGRGMRFFLGLVFLVVAFVLAIIAVAGLGRSIGIAAVMFGAAFAIAYVGFKLVTMKDDEPLLGPFATLVAGVLLIAVSLTALALKYPEVAWRTFFGAGFGIAGGCYLLASWWRKRSPRDEASPDV